MKIVFMGTPGFAVPCLDILIENGYDIVGVITAPDRLGGRGRKQVIESHVKKYAVEKGLNILQPTNLKNEDFLKELADLKADLQIVVAFRMLPTAVWDMPPLGTYNLHGSLLPAYRGAAPINWAVMNGEKETGVTTFKLKHAIDTGDIAYQEKVAIQHDDTVGEVHDKMMHVGAGLILKTVRAIESDTVTLTSQDNSKISKAPKIFKETCEIDFNKNAQEIYNHVRGLSPYPLAWMTYLNKMLKIHSARLITEDHQHTPGKIISDYKTYIHLACNGGYLDLLEIQIEGKRKMVAKDFLNGMGNKMREAN